MRRYTLVACAAALALSTAVPAAAADFGPRRGGIYKAPAYIPAYFSWTGFYVGATAGYGWGTARVDDPVFGATTDNYRVKGGIAGATVGYNYQIGMFVAGIEGDYSYSWIKGQDLPVTIVDGGIETRNTYLGTARARLGYAFDRFLPYITGGYAYGGLKNSTAIGSETHYRAGYTLGGGLEYAFLGNWSAKVEYLYVKLNNSICTAATCFLDSNVKFNTNIVRAGLNYRF
jgi:outer membrane immunogenic protein